MFNRARLFAVSLALGAFIFATPATGAAAIESTPQATPSVSCSPAGHETVSTSRNYSNGTYLSVRVEWNCAGWWNQPFVTWWDDGGFSVYYCFSNCHSGVYYVDHTYLT